MRHPPAPPKKSAPACHKRARSIDNRGRGPEPPRGFHVYNLDKWYWKLLFWVIIFAVLMLVMSLVMGLATLLWPILVIGLVIWMIRGLRR